MTTCDPITDNCNNVKNSLAANFGSDLLYKKNINTGDNDIIATATDMTLSEFIYNYLPTFDNPAGTATNSITIYLSEPNCCLDMQNDILDKIIAYDTVCGNVDTICTDILPSNLDDYKRIYTINIDTDQKKLNI